MTQSKEGRTTAKAATPLLPQGKALVLDIETTDLKGDFGHMLMWSAKWLNDPWVYYARIDESTTWRDDCPESRCDDREVVSTLVELIEQSDMVIYHYGDKFDWPFINTRCLANGLLPPAPKSSVDTCKVARSALKMTSNRLGNLAEFLNDPDAQKGGLSKKQWKLAAQGHKPTLDEMLDYCVEDIIATEGVYLRLRPVIRIHPHIAPVMLGEPASVRCPACGSSNTQSHGPRRTMRQIQHRRRCNACGHTYIGHRTSIPKGE